MKLTGRRVDCYVCDEIPNEDETISDYLDLGILADKAYSISYYPRSPRECPFGRGNWMVDIEFIDGSMAAFKFPLDIKEERFTSFIEPLLDKLKMKMH